jgi:type I restriction enzyme S subunit
VTGRYGSVGAVFYLETAFWPLNTTLYVKDFHGNEPKFIYYVLSHFDFTRFKGKTGVPGVNRNDLHKVLVYCPPLAQQRCTIALLDQFETTTDHATRLVEAKRTYKRGLMQRLLTGRKRFPEFVLTDEMQLGQYGTVPKDWSVVHISEIAREIKARGEVEGSVVYSSTKHEGLVPSLEYFGRQVFSRNLDGYKRLQAGDFAYATNHIEEGSIGILRDGQPPGLVSPMYTVFRPKERVNPEFLFALLKTESYRRVFENRMSASVDRRGSLRWKEFSRIKIGLPTIDEQNRIAETLRLVDVEIRQLERFRELVEMQKRALRSKLLSGEMAVSS